MKDFLAHVSFRVSSSVPKSKMNKIKNSLKYDPDDGDVFDLKVTHMDDYEYEISYYVKESSEKEALFDAEFMVEERYDPLSVDLTLLKSTFTYRHINKSPSPKAPAASGKTKRCPKGTRRNKKTGNCESVSTKAHVKMRSPSPVVASLKKKRCPKGTRRNKKTGNCEKK
jgi:hypothetical protein